MKKREILRETSRRVLWGDREDLLPHMLEHRCPVTTAVMAICDDAGWTFESYVLAALFDREELLVEVTK